MISANAPLGRAIHAILCCALVMPGSVTLGQDLDLGAEARQFEVVACLLPARIRKLGNMTYPERRRLLETSALECELKGGEYTFYDRAAPDSAVAFFKKLADDGSVEAQVRLGDVYQYLYPEPQYEQAAQWYRSAMENGSAQGQMRLARLYERGLGVPQDGLMATNLWRQATGSGEELVLASELAQARTRADERIAELTETLRQRSEEAEQIRSELLLARREIDQRQAALAAAETELAGTRDRLETLSARSADSEEVAALRARLAEQQRRIEDQRFQIDSLQADMGVQEAQLSASLRQAELQNQRLAQELERVTATSDGELQEALARAQEKDAQIARLNQRLQAAQADLERASADHQALLDRLEVAREGGAAEVRDNQDRIAELEQTRSQQERRLAEQRAELESLRVELAAASEESKSLEESLNQQIHATAESQARFARSEAELQRTREQMAAVQVELQAASTELTRLEAERAELQTRIADGAGQDRNADELTRLLASQTTQMERQQDRIAELETLADRYRGELMEISLRRASYAKRTPVLDTKNIRLPSDVKLGRSYSLVIGNNDYQYLNDLENAANDAEGVHRVLTEEYGFDSTLLKNATEKQIFQAFQQLAGKTTENDVVLIYYAGHGYELKNESYWLPVEVQSRQEAEVSGISSLKVADWLRSMEARHVMIIADSCYSGSGIETTGGFSYDLQSLEQTLPFFLKSRSRMMLTSGGVSPVMDGDGSGGEFSIFTRELIGLLKENRGVLHAEALYDHLLERVKYTPDGVAVNQTPMFGSIESAGHECGQFVFIHPSMRT